MERINPASLQMLHVAAHVDAIDHRILPALQRNRTVLLDRYWWSAWIYGTIGRANKTSLRMAIQAEAVHWRGIRPARVFLITRLLPLEPQIDIARWKQISALYKKFASQQKRKHPVTVIPNESTPQAALAEVRKYVDGV